MSTPFILIVSSIITLSLATLENNPRNQLTVIYDSSASDGIFQKYIFKGTVLGLMDFNLDYKLNPTFIDFSGIEINQSVDWILKNKTETIISLLSSEQLVVFTEIFTTLLQQRSAYNNDFTLNIFTPRTIPEYVKNNKNPIKITSLQMSNEARITVILNRVKNVGTQILIPVLNNENQFQLLEHYKKVSSKIFPKLQFLSPVILNSNPNLTSELLLSRNNTDGLQHGILLLSRNWIPENIQESNSQRTFHWFSHYCPHEFNKWGKKPYHLYTAIYVGSKNWDNPNRRKLLRKFNSITGPAPSILSMCLAYDTAMIGIAHLKGTLPKDRNSNPLIGLSGEIRINGNAFRNDGIFFGISALPNSHSSSTFLLQPSIWVLEDLIHLQQENEDVKLGEYQVATSSILTQDELLYLAAKSEKYRSCENIEMEVITHDPFNQLDYRYHFSPDTVPPHIIIPNQHGYGITFKCKETNSNEIITLQIACTPSNGKSIGEPVHCFKSRIRKKRTPYYTSKYRTKQSSPKVSSRYIKSDYSRIGTTAYNSLAPSNYFKPSPTDVYYNNYYSNNLYDSSTPATLTTRLDVPINEDPTTLKPPTAPGVPAKLPELRQVLKAAKPFAASCIGSATGCAVCVLVLGRLPLGAVPAACTGPCFVGTFGTCGSLLGRVFSETTIVCTELFRQGFLDVETFIVDSEFGRKIAAESPQTLLGYHLLASPIVDKMKESESFTRIVAYFALPWAQHMKYIMGYSEEFTWKGYLIHTFGFNVCSVVGLILASFPTTIASLESLGFFIGGLLVVTTFIVKRFTFTTRSKILNLIYL